MVTIYKNNNLQVLDGSNTKTVEIRGLSTDTKPTTVDSGDIANGSVFIEIDTQKIFFFDGENKQWKEV